MHWASIPSWPIGAALCPPEFLLRSPDELEPWTVLDSLGWLKMMSYDLGGSSGWRELDRFAISQIVDHETMMEFWPPYPGAEPLDIPDIPEFYGMEPNKGLSFEQAAIELPSEELNRLQPAGMLFEGIGLQQLGSIGRAHRQRQANPGQRPTLGSENTAGLVLRTLGL